MGLNRDSMIGRPITDFIAPNSRATFGKFWKEDVQHNQEKDCKIELSTQGNQISKCVVRILSRVMPNHERHLAVIDVTEMALATKKLKIASDVFTFAREGIVIANSEGGIIDLNDSCRRITGFQKKELIGHKPWLLFEMDRNFDFDAILVELSRDGYWVGEVFTKTKLSVPITLQLAISCSLNEEAVVEHYIGIFSDISNSYAHREEIKRAAHFDPLTNLPNRTLLTKRLHHALTQSDRHQQSLAIVYIDLDGFKSINDTYGHSVGDQLLKVLADRMSEILRDGDTLSRVGGDEFVLLLGAMEGPYDYIPFLDRLREVTSSRQIVSELHLQVSASMGVTLYPKDNSNPEQLIRHADQAMYEAKESGKNRYHLYDLTMVAKSQILSEKMNDIQQAINNNSFVLHYQPKINFRTGAVVGAEALLRWDMPNKTQQLPDDFLHLIENHRIASEIDSWVINSALKQMDLWQKNGLYLPVSMNIFAHELQDPKFSDRLSEILLRYPNVNPRFVQLEVLESREIKNSDIAAQVMKKCCDLGISFALDDFGTGYSSLNYLRCLPAEVIKIDKSFVCDMLNNPSDFKIVKGVIALARAFGRKIVAEGVISHEIGSKLCTMGCDVVQGFGVAKPMPAYKLANWVSAWNSNLVVSP